MRSEVTGVVRLEQPQYQSAELLIAVLARGFRVVEVPATIHKRQVGESKKGHNAIYGLHYAGVVGGTWWRERRHRIPGGQVPAPATTTERSANGAASANPGVAGDAALDPGSAQRN
jgi:hypothetical protein